MNREKENLYRKDNKKALHYHGPKGDSFCYSRNTKEMREFEGTHLAISSKRLGRDYTPLYKFLLANIGNNWDDVFSEAKSRLDSSEPIFYMVHLIPRKHTFRDEIEVVSRLGESTYYSTLTVNDDGILIKLDENALPPAPRCTCCTHTFNGVIYSGTPL